MLRVCYNLAMFQSCNFYRTSLFSLLSFFVAASFFVAIPFFAHGEEGLVPCGTMTYNADSNPPPAGKSVGDISNPCQFPHLLVLVTNITNFLIIIGAAISALAFGYAGFLMMTAAGEMGKIEEAKAIFGKVVVGFLFMLSAWLIVNAIESAFLNTTDPNSEKKFNSLLGG